jgi:DDE superfamily endonuclease
VGRAFSPSATRAQVTALACSLPRDSGRPLSRWSAPELARAVIQQGIVSSISASTVKRWLQADQIQPWQYRSWQRPTDPRFLERAILILDLYERAQGLARKGHIIVCADEKTSIQARKATGGTRPAGPGQPMHFGDRYRRRGAVQLLAGLLVHRGDTLARCFERKRFGEFQAFLRMLFASLWCKRIRVLHLILDNGSTHAPKQLAAWIRTLGLRFDIRIHWLPVHASWLDQVEIVFSVLQKKVLIPNDFDSRATSNGGCWPFWPSATGRHARSSGATRRKHSAQNSASATDWPDPIIKTRNEFMIRCTKLGADPTSAAAGRSPTRAVQLAAQTPPFLMRLAPHVDGERGRCSPNAGSSSVSPTFGDVSGTERREGSHDTDTPSRIRTLLAEATC